MSNELKDSSAIIATGFRAGRMAQDDGRELVWFEIHQESGPPLQCVCLPEHARGLGELLIEEASSPIVQGNG
jgi:hypothetical protein